MNVLWPHPSVVKKGTWGSKEWKQKSQEKISRLIIHPLIWGTDAEFWNILCVISWFRASHLSLSFLTFISPVKSSWRHIRALIFAQSHVGWTEGELVRGVGERERSKKRRQNTGKGRKPPQTNIWRKQGVILTLATFDMRRAWEERREAGTRGKQEDRTCYYFYTLWLPSLHFQQRN